MARIDKYGVGAAIGSATKTLAEKDASKYAAGDFDEVAVAIARKNLEIQAKVIESLKEKPIDNVVIDVAVLHQ